MALLRVVLRVDSCTLLGGLIATQGCGTDPLRARGVEENGGKDVESGARHYDPSRYPT